MLDFLNLTLICFAIGPRSRERGVDTSSQSKATGHRMLMYWRLLCDLNVACQPPTELQKFIDAGKS